MIENESIAIHDLNSATGTFVDEAKVLGRCTLSSGSVLRIGPFHLELLIGDAESRFATAGSSADQVGNEKLDGDITEMLVRADESERQERMQDPSSRKFVLTNSDVGESSQDDSEAQPEPESPQDALRRRLPPKRRKPGKLPPDHAKQQAANGDDSTEAANDMLRKLFGGE
jgi:pSer/pThr/pTyr-binding forkhead associated (FHA) protein